MIVVERARALLGVPWVHQGRDPSVGIDCAGLVVLSWQLVGEVPDYARNPHNGKMEKELRKWFGEPVVDGEVEPGDVVALGFGKVARHCGIIGDYPLGGLTLIHTDSVIGRVVEMPINLRWSRRIQLVFRK